MHSMAGVVVAGVLFAGALVALGLHQEVAFWALSGLTIVWQLLRSDAERQPGGADDDLVARVEGDGVDAPAVDE